MADISKEINDFREAVYGEEVRGSMISLAEKVNEEAENSTDKVAEYGEAEAAREEAESAREKSEAERVAAEHEREIAEEKRISSENIRSGNEQKRISGENSRADAESARTIAEENREAAESSRASAEKERDAAERGRVTAEFTRENSENGRVSAEEGRVSAEEIRISAESERKTAEMNRETNTGKAIEDCNEATERANNAAQAAEDMVDGKGLIMSEEKGAKNGVATLDENAKIPQVQIDGNNIPITFSQVLQRANIESGDTLAVAFGKLEKFFADLKPYVYADPANSLEEEDESIPLAAPQGKVLAGWIGTLSSLTTSVKTSIVAAINSLKSVVDGKLSTANVINNLLTTAAGYALDARQGKALNDKITTANSNISGLQSSVSTLSGKTTPSTVTLATGVTLQRCGNHRILHLVDAASPKAGDICRLPEGDRPSTYIMASAAFRGQERGDYFISITPKTGTSVPGKVGLFYGANTAVSENGGYIVANLSWYV